MLRTIAVSVLIVAASMAVFALAQVASPVVPPDNPSPKDAVASVSVPFSGIVKMMSSYKVGGVAEEASMEIEEWGNLPIKDAFVRRAPDGKPAAGLQLAANLLANSRDAKVGDYVTFKITETYAGLRARREGPWRTARSKLTVIDKDEKTVRVGMNDLTVEGSDLTSSRSAFLAGLGSCGRLWTTDVTKPFDICAAVHVHGKSSSGLAFAGFRDEDGMPPFGFRKTSEGRETLKIGDTSYDCTWIKGTVQTTTVITNFPVASEVKIWMAKNARVRTQPKAAAPPANPLPKDAGSSAALIGIVKATSSYKFDGVPGEASTEMVEWGNDGRKVSHAHRDRDGKLAGKSAGGNPFRNAQNVKVGDYVVYKTTEKNIVFQNPDQLGTSISKLTVTGRDEKAVAFDDQFDLSTTDLTKPFDMCTAVATIHTVAWPSGAFAGIARNSDNVPFGFHKTGDGKEDVKIGNKTYDCTWIKGNVDTRILENPPSVRSHHFTAEVKIWIANDAPAE